MSLTGEKELARIADALERIAEKLDGKKSPCSHNWQRWNLMFDYYRCTKCGQIESRP